MKKAPPKNQSGPTHQTVTGEFSVKFGGQAIKIGTTNQRLSGHAGQSTFWAWLHRMKFRAVLGGVLPQRPTSPNATAPVDIALTMVAGLLAGADKLARMAWLRGDPVLPALLQARRLVSQSTLTRFLQGFGGAAVNTRCFVPLWRWCLERLPSRREGYILDVDSTALVHEDGGQQGVRSGYTRLGLKPCHQALLAVLAEVKLVAGFWLRQGNAPSASNVLSFTCQLLEQLPRQVRLGLVRADSGFCQEAWLALLEQRGWPYIVAARLTVHVQSLIRRDLHWAATGLAGLDVAEVEYEGIKWSRPRRIILIRRRAGSRGGGKELLHVPGYRFQALVTSLPDPALTVWRRYNGRADMENVIKELRQDFALGALCCHKFWATEAALSMGVLAYNLTQLFARHLGWLRKITATTLRHRLWHCPGIISNAHGRITLRLGISPPQRSWWRSLWEKILAPYPNCNAVDQNHNLYPNFTGLTA
jgi:hypothetical protein